MAKKKSSVVIDNDPSVVDPDVITIDVKNIDAEDDNIEIIGKNQPFSLTMYLDPKVDAKYFDKFIKGVEKIVRGNDDYKMYLTSLREDNFMSQDAFLHNVSSTDAELQLHHYPFNLYTICKVVANTMLEDGEKVSTMIVADKVLMLHFEGRIGLVPLSVTMHEIAHLGRLTFVRSQIYGKWENFYNTYRLSLDEYDHTIVKNLIEIKNLNCEDTTLLTLGHEEVINEDDSTDKDAQYDYDLENELEED